MKNKEVIDLLYTKLPEYITDHLKLKQNKSGFFRCPTGTHPDEVPSCHVIPYNTHLWHCFACLISTNIFGMAHFAEGLPLDGPEFWTITVRHLCEIFSIPYEPQELEDEEKDRYQRLRAYKDASSLICTYPDREDALIYKYLKKRNWDIETAKELQVGVIESFDNYVNQMLQLGWAKYYLSSIELLNKNIFNKNNLIFVVTDEKNRPVGFAARDMHWKKSKDGPPKYINSTTSIIYKKGHILYNFPKAKVISPPLWIVEGYGDCLKMHEKGIKNVVAIGSTFITDHQNGHIDLLKKHDIYDIILVPDNDESGIAGLERSLNIFNKYREFDVKICKLPADIKDADEFIIKYGIEEFKKVKLQKPFNYKLNSYPFDADKSQICKEMVEFISKEKSSIEQYNMIKILALRTEFPERTIEEDVKLKTGDKDFQRYTEYIQQKSDAIRSVQTSKNLQDLYYHLDHQTRNVEQIVDSYNLTKPELEEYKARLIKLQKQFETTEKPGFNCGKFKILQNVTDGLPKGASLIGIAGATNVGKTSYMRDLSWELVKNNDDIVIIFMSIDDSFKKIVPAFIALETELTISEVSKAKSKIWNNEKKKHLWYEGWKKYCEMSKRLIIKDANDGSTIITLEKYIKYYQRLYPNKHILCIVDNFHKLQDFANHAERYALMSNRVKDLSVIYNVPIILVLELRKGAEWGERPTLYDVKESVNIDYDCDMLLLMHQELHAHPEHTNSTFLYPTEHGDIPMPYVELRFAKNKEGDFKDVLYYKFVTNKSQFFDTTKEIVKEAESGGPKEIHVSPLKQLEFKHLNEDTNKDNLF